MPTREINFDGLIGPTHNYAGLAEGNLASQAHRLAVSNPRQAALQGLAKMKFLADLGIAQAVLPPQERPDMAALRRLGFGGSDAQVLDSAKRQSPVLLAACCSASAMWAANAATVSPSTDTADGRVHFTPANLASQFHRSLEAPTTGRILRAIFRDESRFAHHPPLPANARLGDEGAANHIRLCGAHEHGGLEIFVYGRDGFNATSSAPARFPARQTREASESIARLHQLDLTRTLFLRQNPDAIDAGAFHNDVVTVSNENVLLYHADAFADSAFALAHIRESVSKVVLEDLILIEVPASEVPLADAVRSYLFNSQLVSMDDGMALICPTECQDVPSSREFLKHLLHKQTPIRNVHFINVRQSMNNGGGPACLRLRVVLNDAEQAAAASGVFLSDALYVALVDWVQRHYREELYPDDLSDPLLLIESRTALDELTRFLQLGSVYPFQLGNEQS
ncbi:MAG TPA: N-succinylarginine dihydrolase [Tepidisphaeraceae bacterium]|jgi:succinylarginine dihydrolase|nr:N-succinylarginine dihydrolase [Tepidisphaeraceae bacterium]